MHKHTLFVLVAGWLTLGLLPGDLPAQSISVKDLPGYERVQQVQSMMGEISGRVSASNLKWAVDEGKLFFTTNRKRRQVVLENGTLGEAADEPKSSANQDRPARRGMRNPGRARQRTTILTEDGKWRARYKDFNVWIEPVSDDAQSSDGSDEMIQVTTDGTEKVRYGTACWVYGEELFQQDAMWWSPDGKKLAFYKIDESHMKTYFLTTRNTRLYTDLHKEQYPTAGQDNPHVDLLIYDRESGETISVKVDGPEDQYIYGIRFSPDGNELLFHRTNRWQNELDVMAADIQSGSVRKVVSEKQDTWQNNSPEMRFLEGGQTFVWETERNGYKHYELRSMRGERLNALSEVAAYPCQSIVKIDQDQNWFYYTAYSGENPLNLHLHRARLDGSEHRRLTSKPMHHSRFDISPDHEYFVAQYESLETPPAIGLFDMTGQERAVLARGDRAPAEKAGFDPPELFSFTASDGATKIFGTLHKPRNFDPQKKYPLLVNVYGGPQSRSVNNRYAPANPYCELGFLVARIANRGETGRGKAFESANYLNLGGVDIQDQADGVRFLAQREYVDGKRVGITGHSYGGYMSALAVLKFPEVFHVAVAGAPVTDWKNYDTIYTERYMRTPQENKEGYSDGSCMTYAKNLKGKLFLLHGLVDDNVHPSNTWQLVDALQKAGKRFDLMVYPNNAHGFGYNDLKWEYFVRHLTPEPGADAE